MAWSKEWKPTVAAKDTIDIDDVKRAQNVFVGIRGPLSFKDGNKLRTVQVTIIGDLALEYDDDGWEMYHVPTLSRFGKAVPPNKDVDVNNFTGNIQDVETSYDKQPLLNWMKKVQEHFGPYWYELSLLTPDNYKLDSNGKTQQNKDIIQQWCLSVKVE